MKKGLLCVLTLMLAVIMLTACAAKNSDDQSEIVASVDPNSFVPADSASQRDVVSDVINNTGSSEQTYDWSSYDPASEEDDPSENYFSGAVDEYGRPTQVGATAIPLDPIDKPTPTPRPALAFQYERREFSVLGLSFEVPKDWADETAGNKVTFCDIRTHDNYRAWIEVSVETVSGQMKKDELKGKLSTRLSNLQSTEACSEWTTSEQNERKLMGGEGYYATFHGYSGGIEIRGRVHVVFSDGKLITIVYACPSEYVSDYYNVYDKLRSTMKKI